MKQKRKKLIRFFMISLFFTMLLLFTAPSVQAAGSVKSVSVTNVTNKKLSLIKGKTKTLSVKVTTTGKVSKEVIYTSSDESIATVNSKGKITAKKNGSTTILVTSDIDKEKTDSITVTVTTLVTKVKLNKSSVELFIKDTVDLNETIVPADASNQSVKWSSSNTSIASVDSDGIVTAKKKGSVTITATAKDGSKKKATCNVKVAIPVSKITLPKTSTVAKGKTLNLKKSLTITPSNAKNKLVSWSSSNTSIATISTNGIVTGKKSGSVTITATAKDGSKKKATCKVTVIIPVSELTLNELQSTLETGNTLTLKANVWPKNASNQSVKWSSSDTSIATVDTNGIVTTKKAGVATITATATDGSSKKESCIITVRDYKDISSTSDIAEIIDSKTTKYYKFVPQKSGYYYFYVDGSNCKISLYNSTMNEIDNLESIPSLHSKCYFCSLKAKSTYYLDISNSGNKQVAIGITNTRPDTRKISKTLSVEETVTDTISANQSNCYKFIPTETEKYYFFADGTNCSVFLSELSLDSGGEGLSTSFIPGVYTDCYSYTCKAGKIYYFSVHNKYDSDDNITAGITKTKPESKNHSTELIIDKSITNTIGSITKKCYKFTPSKSGTYYLCINEDVEIRNYTRCSILDSDKEYRDINSGDSGKSSLSIYDNCYSYDYEAGKTYYIYIWINNEDYSSSQITLTIKKTRQIESKTLSLDKPITQDNISNTDKYYKFTPSEAGTYYFYMEGFDPDDFYLYYEANFRNKNYKTLNGTLIHSLYSYCISFELEANKDYYCNIGQYGANINIIQYLGITRNNLDSESGILELEQSNSTYISECQKIYYKFTPSESGTYYFYADGNFQYSNLYDSNMNTLSDTSVSSSHTYCFSYKYKANKIYYISLNASIDESATITFEITKNKPTYNILKLKETKVTFLCPNIEQYYKFTPTESGTYYFYTNSTHADFCLYDSNMNLIRNNLYPTYEYTKNQTYYVSFRNHSDKVIGLTFGVTDIEPSIKADSLKLNESITEVFTSHQRKYYTFTPDKIGTYYFFYQDKNGLRITFNAYDEHGCFITTYDYLDRSFYFECTSTKTYYLCVNSECSRYFDEINVTLGITDSEPSIDISDSLNIDSSITKNFYGGYPEYFKFTPQKTGTYYFYFCINSSEGAFDFTLYDNNMEVLEENSFSCGAITQHSNYYAYKYSAGKTYYFRIKSSYTKESITFRITQNQPTITQ